jgi:hypothetical protein
MDTLSVLPFEAIGLITGNKAFLKFKGFRLIRLLRLLKLLKFLQGNAMRRWQNEISIDFGLLSLGKMVVIILTMAHWACCGFRLVPDVVQNLYLSTSADNSTSAVSWLKSYHNSDGLSMEESDVTTQYLAAFYWSIMTLTTLGYGDVTITTNAERVYACFIIILGGGVYAYVVGSICGIISSFNQVDQDFNQNLDLLNKVMASYQVPREMKRELREYFHYSKNLANHRRFRSILRQMSPQLQAKFTRVIYGQPVKAWLYTMMPVYQRLDNWILATVVQVNEDGTYVVLPDNGLAEFEVVHGELSLVFAEPMPEIIKTAALASVSLRASTLKQGVQQSSCLTRMRGMLSRTFGGTANKPAFATAEGAEAVRRASASVDHFGIAGKKKKKFDISGYELKIDPQAEKVPMGGPGGVEIGTRCCVQCPYASARIIGFNKDATIQVEYVDTGVRDMHVPLSHVKAIPDPSRPVTFIPPADRYHQQPPTVTLYQAVMAKTDVPIHEYAMFTAQLAAQMTYVTFRAREVVIAANSKPSGMYMVNEGIVASAGSLYPKDKFFCTEGVLFDGTTDREYRSVTNCYLNFIAKDKFTAIVATCRFPSIEQWLRRHRSMLALGYIGRLAQEYLNMRNKDGPSTHGAKQVEHLLETLDSMNGLKQGQGLLIQDTHARRTSTVVRRPSYVPAAGAGQATSSPSLQPCTINRTLPVVAIQYAPIREWLHRTLRPQLPTEVDDYAAAMQRLGYEYNVSLRGIEVGDLVSKFHMKEGHANLVATELISPATRPSECESSVDVVKAACRGAAVAARARAGTVDEEGSGLPEDEGYNESSEGGSMDIDTTYL